MNIKNIITTLAQEHTRIHNASFDSDLYLGEQFGIEKAIRLMAELPEMKNDAEVQEMLKRFDKALPAIQGAPILCHLVEKNEKGA